MKRVFKIKVHMISYSSLHDALNKKKRNKYIFKSIFTPVNEQLTKRFLAINKLLIIQKTYFNDSSKQERKLYIINLGHLRHYTLFAHSWNRIYFY